MLEKSSQMPFLLGAFRGDIFSDGDLCTPKVARGGRQQQEMDANVSSCFFKSPVTAEDMTEYTLSKIKNGFRADLHDARIPNSGGHSLRAL
ncbi:hypothetical protein AVEN_210152-1 [Araneus ventricosus]|uniref:Uncharacterized protein n=1 Tax=Araneus ventricosus TaxID=182803 RepID=A0A4Y2PTF7_ARAVE|nr:hypothetical protein AVEN_210152-1 [Araneus ventricosus]